MNLTYESIKNRIDYYSKNPGGILDLYEWNKKKKFLSSFLLSMREENPLEVQQYLLKLSCITNTIETRNKNSEK